ncbi:class D beta-lactamase [Tenacibaculum retecalamus]|uniref:class D beta-lactamase n=1 Tax=Tenacibaculum retecalamus TaxID=3018315 RepID=UPI0023D92F3A|nr:class D beta-lactamase [Tenacibaculum retecalamus]WBX71086.1 class D beta-lactamase [Tenacibaculum retecalamus]
MEVFKIRSIAYLLIVFLVISACKNKIEDKRKEIVNVEIKKIVHPEFQKIINDKNVTGAVLIYDFKKDTYYSNDFDWATIGRLPASTFKIPNSIIALELGIVKNDSTLFAWNGEKRAYKVWEQNLVLKQAFHYSCVPCYQEIARKVGVKRMQNLLDKLEFGNMDFNATTIDNFWLEGNSKINQFQQIDFLKQLYESKLPISKRTEVIMKKMMLIDDKENFKLRGKTGLSVRSDKRNGWFVGYLEKNKKVYFFATNIEPNKSTDPNLFIKARKEITFKVLQTLK